MVYGTVSLKTHREFARLIFPEDQFSISWLPCPAGFEDLRVWRRGTPVWVGYVHGLMVGGDYRVGLSRMPDNAKYLEQGSMIIETEIPDTFEAATNVLALFIQELHVDEEPRKPIEGENLDQELLSRIGRRGSLRR